MNITISDLVSPKLGALIARLSPTGRQDLNRAMGYEVQRLTVDHLRQIAATRHNTANKLGGTPTNHWAQAAEKVAQPSSLTSVTGLGATLTINHPGITRALRDVTIKPKEAKSLAIPVRGLAYGRRPAELWDRLNLFIPKGRRFIAMRTGKKITVLYLLVRSVTQKQDRSLLPTDAEFHKAAARGALQYLKMP